jgi:hypothetical protein
MKKQLAFLLTLFVVMAVAAACTPAETAEINKIDPTNNVPDTVCWDGTKCPYWTSCPPEGYHRVCDTVVDDGPGDPYSAGKKHRRHVADAGARIRMIDDDDAGTGPDAP